jgi:hypothetical protein
MSLPDSIFRRVIPFAGSASNLARTSWSNSILYRQYMTTLRNDLTEEKREGRSSTVVGHFWMHPELWDELGESRKNIFMEAVMNGVFLEELYKPKWIFQTLDISTRHNYESITTKILPEFYPEFEICEEHFRSMLLNAATHNNTKMIEAIISQQRKAVDKIIDDMDDVLWDMTSFHSAIKYMLENWVNILYGAAEGGHMSLVQTAIDNGAEEWRYGLHGAIIGGHIPMVEYFLAKVSKSDELFDEMIEDAGISGNMEMVLWIISTIRSLGGTVNYNNGLDDAISSGDTGVIKFFLEKATAIDPNSLCGDEDDEIIEAFVRKATVKIDSIVIIDSMASAGNKKWLNHFLNGIKINDVILYDAITTATKNGHIDLTKELCARLTDKKGKKAKVNALLKEAIESDVDELVVFYNLALSNS